jgi:hypothetical protein
VDGGGACEKVRRPCAGIVPAPAWHESGIRVVRQCDASRFPVDHMRTFLVAALLLISCFLAPMPTSAQRACPPTTQQSERRVRNLLSLPNLAQSNVDMGSASRDSVKPLRTESDGTVCGALWKLVEAQSDRVRGRYTFAFYRSVDRYFVTLTPPPVPPGRAMLRHDDVVEVYDRDFRLLARFGI